MYFSMLSSRLSHIRNAYSTMRGKCVSVIVTAVADSVLRPLQPTAAYLTASPILLFSEWLGPELCTVQLPCHNAKYSRCNRILQPPTQQQKPNVRQHNHCQTAWSWRVAPRMSRHLPRPQLCRSSWARCNIALVYSLASGKAIYRILPEPNTNDTIQNTYAQSAVHISRKSEVNTIELTGESTTFVATALDSATTRAVDSRLVLDVWWVSTVGVYSLKAARRLWPLFMSQLLIHMRAEQQTHTTITDLLRHRMVVPKDR